MAEYASCPRCKGSGLIPLEEATRERVHASVERGEEQQLQLQREQEMLEQQLADQREEATERGRRLESLMFGNRNHD